VAYCPAGGLCSTAVAQQKDSSRSCPVGGMLCNQGFAGGVAQKYWLLATNARSLQGCSTRQACLQRQQRDSPVYRQLQRPWLMQMLLLGLVLCLTRGHTAWIVLVHPPGVLPCGVY
jgi:hypothetical protein